MGPLFSQAGDTAELKVSIEDGSPDFRIELVRLICGDDGPNGPGCNAESTTSEVNGLRRSGRQAIPAGSYVHIPNLKAIHGDAVTLAALVMPTWIGKGASQCILARQDRSFKDVALMMDASGCGGLWLHDGDYQPLVTCGTAIREGSWYLLVACFNAFDGKIRILQRPIRGNHRIERGVLEERSIDLQNALGAGRRGFHRCPARSG